MFVFICKWKRFLLFCSLLIFKLNQRKRILIHRNTRNGTIKTIKYTVCIHKYFISSLFFYYTSKVMESFLRTVNLIHIFFFIRKKKKLKMMSFYIYIHFVNAPATKRFFPNLYVRKKQK